MINYRKTFIDTPAFFKPQTSVIADLMSRIRILPDNLANRIAAGEVVERPVSVVKELVENSLDAHATKISVTIQKGGKSQILVEDNGSGMSSDDAMLSIERHATSKISHSDDLFNIRTLGFRGEALPSIASVSRFLLQTKVADQLEGTEILINGGKLIHKKDVGMPNGTRVEVTHLFSSVPARRKFLKTDNTEANHIIQLIRTLAIANPEVSFRLNSNNRQLINTHGGENTLDRIARLWGEKISEEVIPIEFAEGILRGQGFVSKAGHFRPSRQDIVTIVNDRIVESRTLGYALTEAYHTYIPKGKYPIAFLFLTIDPSLIDVNIHPSKKEVKFKNEAAVRNAMINTLWDALGKNREQIVSVPVRHDQPIVKPTPREPVEATPVNVEKVAKPEMPQVVHKEKATLKSKVFEETYASANEVAKPVHSSPASPAKLEREWRFIGHFDRVYTLFERDSGLTMVHGNRAFSRIAYERVMDEIKAQQVVSQSLAIPIPLQLDMLNGDALENICELLAERGLEISEFGRYFYRIEALPTWIPPEEAEAFIRELISMYAKSHSKGEFMKQLDTAIAQKVAEQFQPQREFPLTREASFQMLSELLTCENPMADALGRPVIKQINRREIE